MEKTRLLLCTILLFAVVACPLSVNAESVTDTVGGAASYTGEEGISPYWINVISIGGTIEPGLFGTYKAAAGVTLDHSNYKATLTCTLQQFTASGWTDTNITWTNSGTATVEASKSWINLSTGDYRIKAVATVYNASGGYVETATSYVGNYTVS